MDLVGAAVLSHAHNAESMVDIREEIGAEKSALGEEDAVATQAQLLAEKRVGFFVLALGLSLYLAGLVLKSTEGIWTMARSEEHTSELQSRQYLVCRLLLEKKKNTETQV